MKRSSFHYSLYSDPGGWDPEEEASSAQENQEAAVSGGAQGSADASPEKSSATGSGAEGSAQSPEKSTAETPHEPQAQ